MPRGPRKLRIVADGVGLTQFRGVALIKEFFQPRIAAWLARLCEGTNNIRIATSCHRVRLLDSTMTCMEARRNAQSVGGDAGV